MKKMLGILALMVLLAGCSQPETLETVTDQVEQPERGTKMHAMFQMPPDAVQDTMTDAENGKVYICTDYVLTANTTESGDLNQTVLETTGYTTEQLYMIETMQGDAKRYSLVWTSASETGQQVGRCVILDDGSYHYVLSAMADAEKAGELSQEQWLDIFSSFQLLHPQDVVNSGS